MKGQEDAQGMVTLKPSAIPGTAASNAHHESVPNNKRASAPASYDPWGM